MLEKLKTMWNSSTLARVAMVGIGGFGLLLLCMLVCK